MHKQIVAGNGFGKLLYQIAFQIRYKQQGKLQLIRMLNIHRPFCLLHVCNQMAVLFIMCLNEYIHQVHGYGNQHISVFIPMIGWK